MKILLANPRGFCAGVDRAIEIVEKALQKFGSPVYVRHEIVHNQKVVSGLREKGAIFVEELEDVPLDAVVIFSAHGVPQKVYQEATQRKLISIDATCPLVKKVHSSVLRHNQKGSQVVLIGHEGHPEVEGTMGQLKPGSVILVGSVEEVNNLEVTDPDQLAFTTQTTLSTGETRDIIATLKKRFPKIKGPESGDMCYATTNRQEAVGQMADHVDLMLVVGSRNSSNSNRLRELGEQLGKTSFLIDGQDDLKTEWFKGVEVVGLTSGASAPEYVVQQVVSWIKEKFPGSEVEDFMFMEENVRFPLPKELREPTGIKG